jgi:DNA/RNA-binding domain of Phe-tRNA-synthetase-like protein
MTTLVIDGTVREAYPEVLVAVLIAEGLDSSGDWGPAPLEWITPAGEDDPAIAAWHAVYRRFGTNPRRLRPSVEALSRRLARTGALPRINAPVDAYNSVSVRFVVAAGAFDLDAVRGDVVLRPAKEGDWFTPLGEPDEVEHPKAGEIVYADDVSVLTRHWNYRDAERTKVTSSSENAMFLLESADGPDRLDAAVDALRAILEPHARSVYSL